MNATVLWRLGQPTSLAWRMVRGVWRLEGTKRRLWHPLLAGGQFIRSFVLLPYSRDPRTHAAERRSSPPGSAREPDGPA